MRPSRYRAGRTRCRSCWAREVSVYAAVLMTGFSFVYLVQDTSSQRMYALKKILITSGNEGVKLAMREVEAYRRFRHPNIIRILDSAVVQDEGGDGKIIYL